MRSASTTLLLEGPLFGAGIDVIVRGRVSERLAARRFGDQEQLAFASARDVPFAAREVVIKAVGGEGILGAPLREMVVAWVEGQLRFRPGPRYRALMDGRGVRDVRLLHLDLDEAHVIVAGVAFATGAATPLRLAWALVPTVEANPSWLSPDELAFARTRPRPESSVATRCAVQLAARELGFEPGSVRVVGGGEDPPRLLAREGELDGAQVSLGHEDAVAVALLAVPG